MAAPNLIIGLGHRKRVGKDTLAELLVPRLEERGYDVWIFAFAHDMKEAAADLFGVYGLRGPQHYESNPEHREQELERIGKTPRQIWIEFGNAMRSIYPNIWIDRIRDQIEANRFYTKRDIMQPTAWIITDVRYPNEAEAIKSWGGRLVKVTRNSVPDSDDVADCALMDFSGWDFHVRNDGTIEDLGRQADALLNHLLFKGT